MRITVVNDFSKTPGGRKIEEGPSYMEALEQKEKLEIDFDGTFGYSPSFLDESFGGLVRKIGEKGILNNICIISNDDLTIERRIGLYVKDAEESLEGEQVWTRRLNME